MGRGDSLARNGPRFWCAVTLTEIIAAQIELHPMNELTWRCACRAEAPRETRGRAALDAWHREHVAERISEALGVERLPGEWVDDGTCRMFDHAEFDAFKNALDVAVYRIRALESPVSSLGES